MSLLSDIWHFYINIWAILLGRIWDYSFRQYDARMRPWIDIQLRRLGPYLEISKEVLLHSIVVFVLASFCLYVSAFLFGALYFYNMPTKYHYYDLDLQYDRKCIERHRSYLRTGNDHVSFYDDSCFPSAIVDFDSSDHQRILEPDQTYQIYLKMDMPLSQQNLDIGMFMVTMKSGELVASKPASIKFRPILIRILSTALFWPLLLFDLMESKQTLSILLFEQVIIDYPDQTQIQSCRWKNNFRDREQCKHRTAEIIIDYPDVQIYSAQLQVHATFTGIQYYLYQWPVFSFLIGTSIFFVPVLASFLVFLYILMWKTNRNVQQAVTERVNQRGNHRQRDRENREPSSVEGFQESEQRVEDEHSANSENGPRHSESSSTSSSIEMIGYPTAPGTSQEQPEIIPADSLLGKEKNIEDVNSSTMRRRKVSHSSTES